MRKRLTPSLAAKARFAVKSKHCIRLKFQKKEDPLFKLVPIHWTLRKKCLAYESPAKALLLSKSKLQIGNVIAETKKAARPSSEGGLLLLY
ncbi:hypothetical protein, partial [Paenibacillus sp. LHD-38]|uniref:hypothetical protein n=1 Tax=Paenibacillus sp. LHD-38 TaxID=3072143 RepID=UPI00280CD53D